MSTKEVNIINFGCSAVVLVGWVYPRGWNAYVRQACGVFLGNLARLACSVILDNRLF